MSKSLDTRPTSIRVRLQTRQAFVLLMVASLVAQGAASDAPTQDRNRQAPSVATIYERCRAACGEVLLDGRHAGTAWLADADGTAVTAAHLFDRRVPRIELISETLGRLPATLLAVDRGHDLALLQVSNAPTSLPFLETARHRPPVGALVYQFGSPVFRFGVLQPGRVARPDTAFEYYGESKGYVEIVHVAADMQVGTSGGPWLNRQGKVVGVQSGMITIANVPQGVAYMTPLEALRRLLESRRDARTPFLGVGVDEVWQRERKFLAGLPDAMEGLVISRLTAHGPADRAGLQLNDIILQADGQRVRRIAELLRLTRRHQPGERMRLTAYRPDTRQTNEFTLTLDWAEAALAGRSTHASLFDLLSGKSK